MRIAWGSSRLLADLGHLPAAPSIAIGNFDGVHLGHQALIAAAVRHAQPHGGTPGVLTFDPHPARFFAPALAPPLLLPLARRLELLGNAGAAFAVVEPFDAALAGLSPEDFARTILVDALHVAHVVVGYDFSFGRKRAGTTATLATLGQTLGFEVTVVPAVSVDGLPCSSTKVREFLLEGRVEGARLLLGRPPEVTGRVVRGAGRGRGMGLPTANLEPELLPPVRPGIYAAWALVLEDPTGRPPQPPDRFPAAVSIGTNPTFETPNAPLTIEAHLLDYSGADLYGARLRLELVAHLRDERRFDTVSELLAEIGRDIDRTRSLLA